MATFCIRSWRYPFLEPTDSTLPRTLKVPTRNEGVVSSMVMSKLKARSLLDIFSSTSASVAGVGSVFCGIVADRSRDVPRV
jgi:hypothetical protein